MWTARATAYRRRAGFDHDAGRVAVVVQRMVAAEVSGVLFTANPVSARTDEMVVNASWGLGEGVVSGILTPDEFVVSTSTLAVKKATTGSKEVQVVREWLVGARHWTRRRRQWQGAGRRTPGL
jgi:pyruvate,water dikinase